MYQNDELNQVIKEFEAEVEREMVPLIRDYGYDEFEAKIQARENVRQRRTQAAMTPARS